MGAPGPRDLTLDTGALSAIARGDERMRALLTLAAAHGARVYVPAAAVAEVWRGGAGRQTRLAAFLHSALRRGHATVVPLDYAAARLSGLLVARAQAEGVGVADAMVAWCALHFNTQVVTSDPNDLERLLSPVRLVRI